MYYLFLLLFFMGTPLVLHCQTVQAILDAGSGYSRVNIGIYKYMYNDTTFHENYMRFPLKIYLSEYPAKVNDTLKIKFEIYPQGVDTARIYTLPGNFPNHLYYDYVGDPPSFKGKVYDNQSITVYATIIPKYKHSFGVGILFQNLDRSTKYYRLTVGADCEIDVQGQGDYLMQQLMMRYVVIKESIGDYNEGDITLRKLRQIISSNAPSSFDIFNLDPPLTAQDSLAYSMKQLIDPIEKEAERRVIQGMKEEGRYPYSQ